jgi:hypothetical protein
VRNTSCHHEEVHRRGRGGRGEEDREKRDGEKDGSSVKRVKIGGKKRER